MNIPKTIGVQVLPGDNKAPITQEIQSWVKMGVVWQSQVIYLKLASGFCSIRKESLAVNPVC